MPGLLKYVFVLLCLISMSVACVKEKDKTPPLISEVSAPVMNDTLIAGQALLIKAKVTDNEALSQLKIEIHGASDGHSHGKSDPYAYWQSMRIVNLSGTSIDIHESFEIPQDAAAGIYHVILTGVDKAGNQSAFVEREVYVKNNDDLSQPEITLSSPAEGSVWTSGTDILVSGNLSDNIALSKAEIQFFHSGVLVADRDIDLALPTHALQETFSTTGWVSGAYTLVVKVYDQVMNSSEKTINLLIE